MVKKDKKSPRDENADEIELPDEVFLALTDFESEAGDVQAVQYTDTSYTSASFESLPPVLPDPEPKHKKVKKITHQSTRDSSVYSEWPEESLTGEPKEEQRRTKKRKKEKRKKHDLEMPRFEKPKNWKEMSKKQRDIWLLEKMEEYKAEKEAEKQAALAGVKERRAAAARERADTVARDDAEQAVRRDLLARTVNLFHKYERQQVELNHKKRLEAEWQQYLRCDGLPDPRAAAQLNTYLHVWRERGACDDNELDRRCEEVLPMLEMLEEFVTDVRQFTPRQIQNYNEVRLELRRQLSSAIHCASYTLLRDIKHRLVWQSIQVATYERLFRGLKLNIYVSVPLPTRKPKPVEPEREAIELSFPSMAATVRLPRAIDGARACVHAAHSALDLLSETCRTHALPAAPADRYIDLFTFNEREHENVCKMKKEQDQIRNKFYKEARDRVKEIEAFIKANPYAKNDKEKEEMEALILSEPADMPDPRAYIAEHHDIEFSNYLKSCTMRTRTGEINLRKYRICNGVLNLDLLVTPPQPKLMAGDIAITTLELPKQLQRMSYEVQYRAPSPPPPGVTRTPEEIEAEIKRTEAEYEKLALVFIELPHSVMWSEPPVVCQWQREDNFWTSHYINDYKFNEDKLTVQFRTGVLYNARGGVRLLPGFRRPQPRGGLLPQGVGGRETQLPRHGLPRQGIQFPVEQVECSSRQQKHCNANS
ncbi:dynein axonemal intermediate chain 7 homolog isoform X2 [Aricia agestis]|uniref:dynein axonemal intermediate chain 7 homolog isoform X2 n=1 Tax=Aricia agestis TaxID=91739 RepID=UPI001C2018E2|nr:dynein axonemal intermediate chain 7 homolog isoform X2 [Aricia agestis]